MPDDVRVYAVGDVHGRADLLERLAQLVRSDAARSPKTAVTVFLGDYVDRGAGTREVIDMLVGGAFPGLVALKGNHEAMLLSFLEDGSRTGDTWRRNGGLETMASYHVDISEVALGRGLERASRELRAKLPASHLQFFKELRTSFELGDYFFCHAGIRPGVPLDQQTEDDLTWIRDEFLLSERAHGRVIVHGHTPASQPEILHNRINIDTGAYLTGRLTCLVLDGTSQGLLQS